MGMNSANSSPKFHKTYSQTRSLSRKLFFYFLKEHSIILFCCVTALLSLFSIATILDDLDLFFKNKTAWKEFLLYAGLLHVQFFTHVLPLSLLIATFHLLSSSSKNNELTALRSSGISILQITLPIIFIGCGSAGIHAFVSEYVAPQAMKTTWEIKKKLSGEGGKKPGNNYLAYRNREDKRNWFFKECNPDGISREVTVTQFRPDRTIDWELYAKEAEKDNEGWIFHEVVLHHFHEEGYLLAKDPERKKKLRMPDLQENPRNIAFLFHLRTVDELSAFKLYRILHDNTSILSHQTRSILETYFYYHLFLPFGCLLAITLGIAFGVTRVRKSSSLDLILAFVVILAYYLCSQGLLVLGKSQVVPPLAASLIPVSCFLGLGVFLIRYRFS